MLLLAQESHPNKGLISVTWTGYGALRAYGVPCAVVEGEQARIGVAAALIASFHLLSGANIAALLTCDPRSGQTSTIFRAQPRVVMPSRTYRFTARVTRSSNLRRQSSAVQFGLAGCNGLNSPATLACFAALAVVPSVCVPSSRASTAGTCSLPHWAPAVGSGRCAAQYH